MTETEIILLIGAVGLIALIVIVGLAVAPWVKRTFYEYNEYTGRWQRKRKTKKKASQAPKNQCADKKRPIEYCDNDRSVAMTRNSYSKLSNLTASQPNKKINFEVIGAEVLQMMPTAKVRERRGNKLCEAKREFVVSFKTDAGVMYFAVGEKDFNSMKVGDKGMLTLADDQFYSFQVFLDVFK